MQDLQLAIFIIQSLNVLVTIIFFILFSRRLFKIKSMGITNKYLDKYWLIRLLMALLYIFISASMLIIELEKYVDQDNWPKQLLMSGSVGFCVNCLILVMHIVVVSQELRKEMPSTRLHQMFLIYLVVISTTRLGLAVDQFLNNSSDQQYGISLLCLAISLDFVSIFMLGFWFVKKKTAPKFDDFSKFDINTVTQRIAHPAIQSMRVQRTSLQRCNIITPNIAMQTGKVRIILQAYTESEILKSLYNEYEQTTRQSLPKKKVPISKSATYNKKPQQHLEIVSDQLYSILEIKKIYLICSRFDIESTINFEGSSMADFFRQVKKFFEELFTLKPAYVPEILENFSIDKETIKELCEQVGKLVKFQSQLMVSPFIDYNALFLSIQVFKHFWVDDHYIFYIHTYTMDEKQNVVCYKRYSDFQEFHKKLQDNVTFHHKSQYKLPSLPKKHFFSFSPKDDEKAVERRNQLQDYCQQAFNDYLVMTKFPNAKQLIFNFLGLRKTVDISPNIRKPMQFYDGLQIRKAGIYKALVQQQYVTFYEFELLRHGILIRSIYKRFRDFISLQNSMQTWMQNNQIVYKLITLPQKHLYKSETKRHENLVTYIENIISVKEIYKIHAVNKFFNLGAHFDYDNSGFGMSIIKRNPSDCEENMDDRKIDSSNNTDKMGMSLLIEELGEDA